MKRILATFGVTSVALLGTSVAALAVPEDEPGGGESIKICHATGSATNPYVVITISVNGLNGHGNANHQLEEDIIPGMANWDTEHQAIYDNACVKPPVVYPPDDDDDNPPPPHDDDDDPYPPHDDDDDDNPPPPPPHDDDDNPPVVVPPNNPPAGAPAGPPPAVVPAAAPPAAAPAVVPPAGRPAVRVPAAAGAAMATPVNEGFNVQTAAAARPDNLLAPWLGGLAAAGITMVGLAAWRRAASARTRDVE